MQRRQRHSFNRIDVDILANGNEVSSFYDGSDKMTELCRSYLRTLLLCTIQPQILLFCLAHVQKGTISEAPIGISTPLNSAVVCCSAIFIIQGRFTLSTSYFYSSPSCTYFWFRWRLWTWRAPTLLTCSPSSAKRSQRLPPSNKRKSKQAQVQVGSDDGAQY